MSSIQQVQLHKEASERQRDSLGSCSYEGKWLLSQHISTGASGRDKRLLSPNAAVVHSLSHSAISLEVFFSPEETTPLSFLCVFQVSVWGCIVCGYSGVISVDLKKKSCSSRKVSDLTSLSF